MFYRPKVKSYFFCQIETRCIVYKKHNSCANFVQRLVVNWDNAAQTINYSHCILLNITRVNFRFFIHSSGVNDLHQMPVTEL